MAEKQNYPTRFSETPSSNYQPKKSLVV